ncbi:MAG: diaminopimelate epimerase [Zoogloeaceae bacterium]|jgi:diaminopimelate epimerase|nr:diaminopimelate epimerase [Zoogloeaceae bacterium]
MDGKLRFAKMHGLGNDFMVIDGVRQQVALAPDVVRRLADRHFGVGFDQLLLVEAPAAGDDVDFRYRIFNADGGEVEQCGNGARCFARFVHETGLTEKREIRVRTASGVIVPRLEEDGLVTVNMGRPRFAPAEIPFIGGEEGRLVETLALAAEMVPISVVNMGNPHAVLMVTDVDAAPVARLGPEIEAHPRFPERVNVGFMQVTDRRAFRLRVFERGAGETLACGTGACAAAVAGMRRALLDSPVRVTTHGGELVIAWAGVEASVFMTGPAVTVFTGVLRTAIFSDKEHFAPVTG